MSNVDTFAFENSIIKECRSGIMTIKHSNNVYFSKSKFYDNEQFNLINIGSCYAVGFEECLIEKNRTMMGENYALFSTYDCPLIEVTDCIVSDNEVEHLFSGEQEVIMDGTVIRDNAFKEGNPLLLALKNRANKC